jgi:MoxR-like ATPase
MGALVPLVARAGVLAEVDSALAAARAGRGTLLTVTGEPGIGKTRLAEAAAGRAAGFEVVWTWCPAAAGGAALRPWSRVVRVLASRHTAVARLIADSPFLAGLADPARAEGRRDPGARARSCPSTWPR